MLVAGLEEMVLRDGFEVGLQLEACVLVDPVGDGGLEGRLVLQA